MLAINGHVEDMLVVEAVVAGDVRSTTVLTDLNAFAFGAQYDALRIFRIDQNCVDHPIAGSHPLPFATFVGGLPQAAGGAGVQSIGVLRILFDQLGAAEHERDATITLPVLSGVKAVVDARARRCVDVSRILWVDYDAHYV